MSFPTQAAKKKKKPKRQNTINTTSYANLHINSDPIYTSQQSFLWVAGLLIAGLRLLPPRSSKTSGAWPLSRFLGGGDRHFQPYACKARSTLHGARPAANPAGSYPGRGAGLSLHGLAVDGDGSSGGDLALAFCLSQSGTEGSYKAVLNLGKWCAVSTRKLLIK